MTVRMYHPEHGWTHAYSEKERKELEALGWKVEQPPQPPKERKRK